MKNLQTTIATVLFIFVIGIKSNPAKAGAPMPVAQTTIQSFVKNTLQNEQDIRMEKLNIEIGFMITADNQMIITSTNNENWDAEIKSIFNYKKVVGTQLEFNQVYHINIAIQ